ncbi:MAG: Ig-like domain-containing protein, partial [Clostridia bacterium]|nr:Ig-like domain-containing protein [Clostridia bacterium]
VTTFEYSGVVSGTVLYLTFSANVWIYTVDVKVTGEDTSEPEVLDVKITPDTVELVLSDGASVTSQIVANVTMTKGDYAGGYSWTSDNESIAAVVGDGAFATVTAKSAGTAVITVTLDGGKNATCTVTVSEPAHVHSYVVSGEPEWSDDYLECIATLVCQSDDGLTCDAPSITVDASVSVTTVAATCTEYGSITYTATYQGVLIDTYTESLSPAGHSYGSPKWTWTAEGSGYSATASFTCTSCGDMQTVNAAVTESGGTYTATVTFEGQSYSASFNPETDTGEIVLSASRVSFSEAGATFRLEVLLSDLQSNYPGDVTWSSGDESVVKVSETGVMTSVGNGTALVSATTNSGLTACCFVEVDIKVKGEDADIKIDDLVSSGTLSPNETISSTKNLYTGGDGTKVTAVGGNSMKVTGVTGEYSYTLNLGGTGKQDSRNVTIETVGAATITVYTKSS